ncbi:hypothetical protein LP100_02335 [Moraxella bovis]|uniref:DNA-binding protein n=1 Tax=Moraxella bovis TaxID=476 RepID=UPI0022265873|nr:DNA-binding protein [Moraxella bovis]UZA49053.1 hypothetical protein LP100_02335 [Moraxella bovis]
MKKWYSAQELTDLQLDSLPKSKSNVINFLKKNDVANQKRQGKGGGLEYAFDGLPKKVQAEIKARQTAGTHTAYQGVVALFAIYAKCIGK